MSTTTITPETSAAPTETTKSDFEGCGSHMAQPTKEHEWLKRFVGEWDLELEMSMGPNEPVSKTHGRETCEMLGDFWLVSRAENLDFPYRCQLTLGFNPAKAKYVATWTDSMMPHLWIYEGTVDAAGRKLTLITEGPSPMGAGQSCRFEEATVFESDDHRVFTSRMETPDGRWNPILTIHFRRRSG